MRPVVHSARKKLPGHVRQRIKCVIDNLEHNPRPARSKTLDLPETVESSIIAEWEVRRFKMENWRIIYAVNETWQEIAVFAIQKRPPYDYEDLEFLLSTIQN
jgi:mRNA interferase RelE/StbE